MSLPSRDRRHLERKPSDAKVDGMTSSTVTTQGMAVRLTGLAKSYGSVHAVRGVDLDIAPGEVVALLGPNGAGKSTTVDMLLGLAKPDRGEAKVFGRDPRQAVAD